MKPYFHHSALLAAALALAACSMAPDYERPQTGAAANWSGPQEAGAPVSAEWWTNFGDPELTLLMQTAMASNLDIAQALARIDQARGAARA
ncbi:MAG: RND transporter, partial [Pseudomonadota bacterium]